MKWLRRRVIASIATQTAETFAVVAVLVFGVLKWLTNQGPWTALFGSVVIAQLVAAARIAHALRKNPLTYKRMRGYIDRPFNYRVSRFQGDEGVIHPTAARLPGFVPVATISDTEDADAPDFGVYHDPSRLVAASVNESSGSLALVSSLIDGRILATIARPMPPHERLVLNVSDDDGIDSVIASHRRAVSGRSDLVELSPSAHQVVLDMLAMEFASYQALGPVLSPFLDLEPGNKSVFRLAARLDRTELNKLPNLPINGSAEQFYTPASENQQLARRLRDGILAMPVHDTDTSESDDADAVSETHIDVTAVAAPLPDSAKVAAVATPHVALPNIVEPSMAVPPTADITPVPPIVGSPVFESVVADVPATAAVDMPVAQVAGAATPMVVTNEQVPDPPLDLTAAIASLSSMSTIDTPIATPETASFLSPTPAEVAAVEPAAASVVVTPAAVPVAPTPVAPTPAPQVAAAAYVAAPAPEVHGFDAVVAPAPVVPAASLAEAVMSAPDTVAALTNGGTAESATPYPSDVDPLLVPNLSAALGRNEEPSPSRPRLSEVIRANSAHSKGPVHPSPKRSRRKPR